MIIINQEEMVIIMGRKKMGFALVAILGILISGCKAELTDFKEELTKVNETIQNKTADIFKEDYMIVTRRKEEYQNEEFITKKDGDNYYIKETIDYVNGSREVSETWYIKTSENLYTVYESRKTALTYREIYATSYEVTSLDVLSDYYDGYYMAAIGMIENDCNSTNTVCEFSKGLFGNKTMKVITTESNGSQIETITIKKGKIIGATTEVTGDLNTYEEIEFDYGNQSVKVSNKGSFKKA